MCNTPVIVTDCCGCSDIIKHQNCGYLVKYGDTKKLAETIKEAIEGKKEERNIIKECQKYIIDNLTYHKVVAEMESVYEICIQSY
jgi:glycosyltransferase involved in cell wall biosynthesis